MAKVLEHEKAAVVELFAVGALNRLQVASKDRPTVGAIACGCDLDLGGEGGVGGESALGPHGAELAHDGLGIAHGAGVAHPAGRLTRPAPHASVGQ